MIIKNKSGIVMLDTDKVPSLSGANLRNADFSGQSIEGLDLSDADLRGADFSDADLYWAFLFRSNCEGCSFRGARLDGAVLDETNLRGTDLTGAYVSYDQVGGAPSMLGADLTAARVEGLILREPNMMRQRSFPSASIRTPQVWCVLIEEIGNRSRKTLLQSDSPSRRIPITRTPAKSDNL